MTRTNVVAVATKVVAVIVAFIAVVTMARRAVKKFTSKAKATKNIIPNHELEQVGINRYDWGYEKFYIKKGATKLYDNNDHLMFVYPNNDGYKIKDGVLTDTNEYPFDMPTKFDLTKGAILRKEDIEEIVTFEGEDIYLCYIVTKDKMVFNCANGKEEHPFTIISCRALLGESHIEESEWDSYIESFNVKHFKEYRALN